ncbi:MAG: BrnA antitoxin family protein [Oceanicaulis sp.]
MGRTVRVRLEDLPPMSEERLREIEAIRDEDIDFSDIPELDEDWFAKAEWRNFNEPKKQLTVRFNADVIEFFKQGGRGYQTRMNAVLRAYMNAVKRDAG